MGVKIALIAATDACHAEEGGSVYGSKLSMDYNRTGQQIPIPIEGGRVIVVTRDCAMPIITDVAVAACCTEFAIWLMSARSGGVVYEGQSHQLNPNWEVMSPDRNHLTKYVILHLNVESDI